MTDGPVVEANGISKRFGPVVALEGVDLSVRRGEALAMFGPNGAGKTTLLRVLSSVLKPTTGTVRIGGYDPWTHEREARAMLGVLSHQTFLYDALSPTENLLFFARLYGVPEPERRAADLLASLGLEARAEDPSGQLSRGMQQRVALARALIHDPEILLLDEPFTGLDPVAAATLREMLASLRRSRRTLVLVTHDLSEGLALCDSWIVLAQGTVAGSGRCEDADRGTFVETYLRLAGAPPAPGEVVR